MLETKFLSHNANVAIDPCSNPSLKKKNLIALFYFEMTEPTYMLLFIFSRFLENHVRYSYFAAKLWEAPKDWLRW